MIGKAHGISLIELLIMVVLISVVATAFWNFHLNNTSATDMVKSGFPPDPGIREALDKISYHIRFAGRGLSGEVDPLLIIQGDMADQLKVFHGDSCYEYLLENNRLIERSGESSKVLAEDIISLKFMKMGQETVVVTVSRAPDSAQAPDSMKSARSYSAVVHADAIY